MSKNKRNTDNVDKLLASVTEEMLGDDFERIFEERGLRVERILLDLVRPDPIQPRRMLPEDIHQRFHNSRLTPSQALRELVQSAQVIARQNSRPFTNVLELLPDPEKDDDETAFKRSPEERILRDLTHLAVTIRDDGQVNPLTVVDVTEGVTKLFRIETGERRYWATWLLRDFIPGYTGDSMIPCIIIPAEVASPFRQAKENTARSGLSAIAMARQAALLLLTVHGYDLPATSVDNDFYRQALDLDLRGKREYTAEILAAMGGIRKMQFSRYKAILKLSDEAMALADRNNIEEKKLRYVINLSQQFHAEVIRQIVDFNLTSKQVKELCEMDSEENNQSKPEQTIPKIALQMLKATTSNQALTGQDLARAALQQERDVSMAQARLTSLRRLLDDAIEQLEK